KYIWRNEMRKCEICRKKAAQEPLCIAYSQEMARVFPAFRKTESRHYLLSLCEKCNQEFSEIVDYWLSGHLLNEPAISSSNCFDCNICGKDDFGNGRTLRLFGF